MSDSFNFNDAALGDALTNTGGGADLSSLFGGGSGLGGSSLSDLLTSVGGAFASGSASPTGSSVTNANATDNSLIPPSVGASDAINPPTGGNAPSSAQSSQTGQGGQGGQGSSQFAPPSAVDQLKKALAALTGRRQQGNPYTTGGGVGAQSPALNAAASIPTGAAAPPSARAEDIANDNAPPVNFPTISPADATAAGLRSDAPANTGGGPTPAPANENTPAQSFPDFLNNLRTGGGGAAPPVQPAPAAAPPTGGGGGGLGGIGGLAQGALSNLFPDLAPALGPLGVLLGNTSPAETGELKPGQTLPDADKPQPDTAKAKAGPLPSDPVGELPTKEGYEKWLKDQGYKPTDAKKIADKSKLPTKKEADKKLPTKVPLPTHKGPPPETRGVAPDGHGPIMRDVTGASTGVPSMLGDIAKMAMPLLMMAMQGGFGGGGGGIRFGRHGGRGFGGMGHPGGRGMWPYHHPTFGWGAHGFHPGGNWKPMDPRHMNELRGGRPFGPRELHPIAYGGGGGFGGGGGTGNPQLDQLLQSLGIDTGGGQGGQKGSGFGRNPQAGQPGQQGGQPWSPPEGGTGGNPLTGNETTGSADDVLATIRQRESGGNNTAPWEGHDASGYYQIKPQTWAAWARDSGDTEAQKYSQAYLAPQAVQDRMARWALKQYGPNASYTWAASGSAQGRPYPNVDPNSWGGAGKTKTGGSNAANPQGNPANVDTTPTVTQMGPENAAA